MSWYPREVAEAFPELFAQPRVIRKNTRQMGLWALCRADRTAEDLRRGCGVLERRLRALGKRHGVTFTAGREDVVKMAARWTQDPLEQFFQTCGVVLTLEGPGA